VSASPKFYHHFKSRQFQSVITGGFMKNSSTIFLLMALLAALPVHNQNRSDNAVPPKRVPFRNLDRKRHFDKAGMNSLAGASFKDRAYSQPWRSVIAPHHKRSERWMNSPGGLFERSRHEQITPPRATGSNEAQSFSDSVRAAWVKHYASQSLPGTDVATAITVDGAGNVYVTGFSTKLPFGTDYFTAKYSAAGAQLWAVRYGGDEQIDNAASAITVDGAGNVYVTGSSEGSGTSKDYATIKYNAAGVQQWVARYDGPGNDFDYAAALAVDGAGNVYVTGSSYDSGTSDDYTTIKYNATGVQQWVARYDGPGNDFDFDYATALAVDGAGNVYVTGSSYDSGTYYDYATIKYNAAGAQQWVVRYNGPRNDSDYATALAVDGAGNVYVTGASDGSSPPGDYATIKYNAAGVQQWLARYDSDSTRFSPDGATALAVDSAGNVYVTGISYGSGALGDYATIKYNAAGVKQWVARYNGPENSFDFANALAVDGAGNVYVTGYSYSSATSEDYATIKYNPAGVEQWVARYDGPGNSGDEANALAVDNAGNVYVTGGSEGSGTSDDYATIKYNAAGVVQWVARYNGPGNSYDEANALAVDGAGNVYVTGSSEGSGTSEDYATIKYNAAGVQQWVARYNGPGNGFDSGTALVVDGAGNVYVTGESDGSGTSSDYVTIKYNAAGVQQWVARYDGPGNSFDEATALTVDGAGNVYVTGSSEGSGTSEDYATIKYNAAGVQQWVARYNGPGNSYDEATALAVDGAGNVYVTGESDGSGTSYDYATIKYNAAGVQQWVARYNGPGNSYDYATALAIDGAGNVYVTGESDGSGTFTDYATIKYNTAGVQQWVARYDDPGNSDDRASALAIDGTGNVYVTGGTAEVESFGIFNSDYATIKYNTAGEQQWVARYNGPGNSSDYATALAVDGAGNVYVTGESYGSGTSYDYTTIKYNAAGVQQWITRNNGPGNSYDEANALAVDGAGNVYVTGTSDGGGWSIYTTIKYVQATVSVEEKKPNAPNTYWLAQNYPNPFNPSTTIRYAVAKSGHVTLKVFNLQGQEIAALVNENKPAGEYEIQWNPTDVPSGVYLYRLQAGKFVQTMKLILLR
jgi:uncharacterized delta-60 repeat protein